MIRHINYINRACDLAKLGHGNAAPNPIVGAVIVYNNKIIGEGYHEMYGQAHAEVNAVNSVAAENIPYLKDATIYVSLEPCCIHGNTPPCSDLILKHKIPRVVLSAVDLTSGVNGKSIKLLKEAGCDVTINIAQKRGEAISLVRNTYVSKERPFIILKYAQSKDGFIGKANQQVWLSNPIAKRLVHKWRSETAAILVGTNTAAIDNPQLTNRLYYGKSPLRIVLDKNLRLSNQLQLFDDSAPTWIIHDHSEPPSNTSSNTYIRLAFDEHLLPNLLKHLYQNKKSSLIVEGGAQLLHSFIKNDLWDEARIFNTPTLLGDGIAAPKINGQLIATHSLLDNELLIVQNKAF